MECGQRHDLVGVRFRPSDGKLVEHYLHNWVHGLPLSSNAVVVGDVYSTEPWNILFGEDEAFFFSKRRLKGKEGRAARTAGKGSWHLEKRKEQEVVSDITGLVVGRKSFLSYSYQGCKNYGWTMYEYVLSTTNQSFQDMVLCRIKKSSRHMMTSNNKLMTKRKRKRQDDDDCDGIPVSRYDGPSPILSQDCHPPPLDSIIIRHQHCDDDVVSDDASSSLSSHHDQQSSLLIRFANSFSPQSSSSTFPFSADPFQVQVDHYNHDQPSLLSLLLAEEEEEEEDCCPDSTADKLQQSSAAGFIDEFVDALSRTCQQQQLQLDDGLDGWDCFDFAI